MEMTILRWTGLMTGVGLFAYVFWLGRRGRMRGLDLALGFVSSAGLAAVSVFPQLITIMRDMLALEYDQYSRLIALSIVSNVVLWVLFIASQSRWTMHADQFDLLVRNLAVSTFEHRYAELLPLPPILIVIPAFNEEDNIGAVLRDMPSTVCQTRFQILVVDDASTDFTADRVREAGVPVAQSPLNRGQGAALRIGADIARRYGAEFIVTMDADGQHLPSDLEGLVKPIIENQYDFVIGSRILGHREKDSAVRYLGIHFFNSIIRFLTPVKVTDCSNGYRALRVSSLSKLVLRQDQYQTPELIIEAARSGVRIGEAPVTVKRRLSGESKKGRNLFYGFSFARSIFKTWWR